MPPSLGDVLQVLRAERWRFVILLCFLLSLVVGLVMRLRPDPYTSREVMYVRLVGELWLNALRAVGLPLLVCSLACAIYDMGVLTAAKYGGFVLVWTLTSKLVVCCVAVGLSALVVPGTGAGAAAASELDTAPPPWLSQRLALGDAVLDMFRAALPENPVEACVRYAHLVRIGAPNDTEPGTDDPFNYKHSTVFVYQADMLGVVVGTFAVGVAMALLGDGATYLVDVSSAVRDACVVLTGWLMAPAGPCLMLVVIAKLAGAYDINEQLDAMILLVWPLVVTIVVQLLLYLVVYLPVTWGYRPRLGRVLWYQTDVAVTAFASASTHVTYPLVYRGLVEDYAADQPTASLVLALSSVLAADGSAALLASEGLWAVQRQEMAGPVSYGAAFGLGLLGSWAAFGEARMHPHLLVMVLTVLQADSRVQDMAPMLVLSWLLDALAAVLNVAGGVVAAASLSAVRQKELEKKADE